MQKDILLKVVNTWNNYTYANNLDCLRYAVDNYKNDKLNYNDDDMNIRIKINNNVKLIICNNNYKKVNLYKRKEMKLTYNNTNNNSINIINFIDNIKGLREVYYYDNDPEYPYIYMIKYYSWNKRNITIQGKNDSVFYKFLTLPFIGYPKYGNIKFNVSNNLYYFSYDQFLMESPHNKNEFIWHSIRSRIPTNSFMNFMYRNKLYDPNILLKKYYNVDFDINFDVDYNVDYNVDYL
jgi:hypothetical protein